MRPHSVSERFLNGLGGNFSDLNRVKVGDGGDLVAELLRAVGDALWFQRATVRNAEYDGHRARTILNEMRVRPNLKYKKIRKLP
jgi:hypothetical protein